MSVLRCQLSMSLDGFVAGPNQSEEDPLGEGGEALHEWALELAAWQESHGREGGEANVSSVVIEEAVANVGAVIMGRNMFGGGPGPWDTEDPWNGWWGDEPPFHAPTFVLTHHERESLEMEGGTTFHFVTGGIEEALDRARSAAGTKDISVGGGADTFQQYLRAGHLDQVDLTIVPVLLGDGERLFEATGNAPVDLECTRVIEAPGVTHLRFAVSGKS